MRITLTEDEVFRACREFVDANYDGGSVPSDAAFSFAYELKEERDTNGVVIEWDETPYRG